MKTMSILNISFFLATGCATFDGTEKKLTEYSIQVSEIMPPVGKRCDFMGVFDFDSISGSFDSKAKQLVDAKIGKRDNGGESANYLVKLGYEGKLGDFLSLGHTMTHHYAAYYCYVPLAK